MRPLYQFLLRIRTSHRLYHFARSDFINNLIDSSNKVTWRKPTTKNMCSSSSLSKSELFQGKLDRYDGVTVSSDKEPCPQELFEKKLDESLNVWIEGGMRGVWFNVHINQSEWIPLLVKRGFKYHHAKNDYLMLYLWLPKDQTDNVPAYAHHMIGVGAIVVNDKNEILVVSEKYLKMPHWKLPGGYVEPGENLVDAAIREVWEETNISTEFVSLIGFRHTHNGMFGCSDIYTIINLKPISSQIEKCNREISDCKWMDLDEYLKHPDVHQLNKLIAQKYLDYKKKGITVECIHGIHQILHKPYTFYCIADDDPSGKK